MHVGRGEELLPQLPCRLVLRPRAIKLHRPRSAGKSCGGLSHLLAQRPGAGIGVFHFRGRKAFGGDQRRAEGRSASAVPAGHARGIRQRREHLQPLGEMADRLHIGRALDGSLTGLLPVDDGLMH